MLDRHKSAVNYFFVFLVSLSLIFIIIPSSSFVNSSRVLFSYLLKPELGSSRYFSVLREVSSGVKNIMERDERNRRLEEDLKRLKVDLLALDSMKSENKRFSTLLDFQVRSPYKGFFARVIGINPYSRNSSFFINKGSKDFVKEGYPVIGVSPEGYSLIGRVNEVYTDYSKVVLITNPLFYFTVTVGPGRADALMRGENKVGLRLDYISASSEVKIGDEIYTSDRSITFPPGIPVGKVTDIFKDKSAMNFYGGAAAGLADPAEAKEVFVMSYEPPAKIQEEISL